MFPITGSRFDREMGCTLAEFSAWLPGALGAAPHTLEADGAQIQLTSGTLRLSWAVQPPRVIGAIRLPVLRLTFDFDSVDAGAQTAFMRRFDLYMQRGGG